MPVQAAPTVFGTPTSNSSGSGGGASTATFTVPTGVLAGHTGVLFMCNAGSATVSSITGTTNGWSASASTPFANGSTLTTHIYSCALTAADSGVTITVNFSVSQRWTGGVVAFAGANQATETVATAQRTLTTTNTAVALPTITPATGYGMLCYFVTGNTFTVGTTSTITPGSGLTERFDVSGSNATASNIACEVATIPTGQAGQILQAAPTGCVTDTATKQNNVMVVNIPGFKPVSDNNYQFVKVGDGMSVSERTR